MKNLKARVKAGLKARVKAGMAFLDVKFHNWRKKINLKKLDLSDVDYCILGQLDTDYDVGINKLELTDQISYDLGFHISATSDVRPGDRNWGILTKAWKKNLKK